MKIVKAFSNLDNKTYPAIKKTVTPYVRDDRFMLHCTVVLIENIAETSEFEVDLDKKE